MTSKGLIESLPLWQNGWYRSAQKIESPNSDARPDDAEIDLIVLHAISLPPGEYGGGGVVVRLA